MAYRHRIGTSEMPTSLTVPVTSNAALRVVVGTAPVNLAKDPEGAVNTPIVAYSFLEATEKLGYSEDFKNYTLCEIMDVSFRVFNVAPVILINVLDPAKHKKTLSEKTLGVAGMRATLEDKGVMLGSMNVKNGDTALTRDVDYIAEFNAAGGVDITLLSTDKAKNAVSIKVSGSMIDPSMVKKEDIVGGYNAVSGKSTGIELISRVYPKLGMVPGMLLAPRWSKDPMIAAALTAKTEDLNGCFQCECIVDLDTEKAKTYSAVKEAKENAGLTSAHCIVLWPMVKLSEKVYSYSSVWGAMAANTDMEHGDVPYKSPSNENIKMTGAVLEDGTEVYLDIPQAEVVNGVGVVTAINDGGWKSWGNETAAYPENTDVKDRFIACRRMMSWYRNHFILNFKNKVDDPTNYRLIEALTDSENIFLNSLKSAGNIAGGKIMFREEDNPITNILDGHIIFYIKIAFFTPAKFIEGKIEFDPTMLKSALGGE